MVCSTPKSQMSDPVSGLRKSESASADSKDARDAAAAACGPIRPADPSKAASFAVDPLPSAWYPSDAFGRGGSGTAASSENEDKRGLEWPPLLLLRSRRLRCCIVRSEAVWPRDRPPPAGRLHPLQNGAAVHTSTGHRDEDSIFTSLRWERITSHQTENQQPLRKHYPFITAYIGWIPCSIRVTISRNSTLLGPTQRQTKAWKHEESCTAANFARNPRRDVTPGV